MLIDVDDVPEAPEQTNDKPGTWILVLRTQKILFFHCFLEWHTAFGVTNTENSWVKRNLHSLILLIDPGSIVYWNASTILISKWWMIWIQRAEKERTRVQLFQCLHSQDEKTGLPWDKWLVGGRADTRTHGSHQPWGSQHWPGLPGFWEKLTTEFLLNNEMVPI